MGPIVITEAEDSLLDNDASPSNLVWVLGRQIHQTLRAQPIKSASGLLMIVRGEMFTGVPVVRSKVLNPTTAICLDVREAVAVPVSVENELFTNRISKPGTILLTLRTHADITWVRPKLVYRLTRA